MTRSLPKYVYRNGSGYLAKVRHEGREMALGTHRSPEEAARVVREFRTANPKPQASLRDKFDSKWRLDEATGCWLWHGAFEATGYGQIRIGSPGKLIAAHRIAWELYVGPIPEGLWVLHNCPAGDTRSCVRPEHLFIGTRAENMLDMVRKGRSRAGRGKMPFGVYFNHGRYTVKINKKNHGTYDTIDQAAGIAQEIRRQMYGFD